MKKQEERFEEDLEWEKKKRPRGKEVGLGNNGELSPDELKRWFLWAGLALGICLVLICVLAVVSSGRNKKEAAYMEVDFGEVMEFTLNRKGDILKADEGCKELEGESLEKGIFGLLDLLSQNDRLSEGDGLLITVWQIDAGLQVDTARLAEEIGVYAETGLKKKQSNTTIYVSELSDGKEFRESSEKYGISLSKAAFIKGLIDKNIRLKLQDESRLAGISMRQLAAEIAENKYDTSFDVVTAKKIYGKKAEETSVSIGTRETEAATEEETDEQTGEAGQTETKSAESSTEALEESEQETEAEAESEPVTEAETHEQTETTAAVPTTTETAATEPHTTAPAATRAPETAKAPETTATIPPTSPETTAAPPITPITPAPAPTEPETTAPAATAAPLEVLPISPAETSPETQTLAPYQVGPGYTQAPAQVHEVVPVAPGSSKGPGY